ncbi:hypothetical protein NKH77_04905 [Streptomyces sp. M19]
MRRRGGAAAVRTGRTAAREGGRRRRRAACPGVRSPTGRGHDGLMPSTHPLTGRGGARTSRTTPPRRPARRRPRRGAAVLGALAGRPRPGPAVPTDRGDVEHVRVRAWHCAGTGSHEDKVDMLLGLARNSDASVIMVQEACADDVAEALRRLGPRGMTRFTPTRTGAPTAGRHRPAAPRRGRTRRVRDPVVVRSDRRTAHRVRAARGGLQRGVLCGAVARYQVRVCTAHLTRAAATGRIRAGSTATTSCGPWWRRRAGRAPSTAAI